MAEPTVREILQTNYHNHPIGYKVMFVSNNHDIRYTRNPTIEKTPKWLSDLHVESWYLKLSPSGLGRPTPFLIMVLDVILPEDEKNGESKPSYFKLTAKHRRFPVSWGLMRGN